MKHTDIFSSFFTHLTICGTNQILRTTESSWMWNLMMTNEGHTVLFGETQVLSSSQKYFARLQRQAVENYKYSNHNMNKQEKSLTLNKYWLLTLRLGKIAGPVRKKSEAVGPNIDQPAVSVLWYMKKLYWKCFSGVGESVLLALRGHLRSWFPCHWRCLSWVWSKCLALIKRHLRPWPNSLAMCNGIKGNHILIWVFSIKPVSYTHLDVYKRQILRHRI